MNSECPNTSPFPFQNHSKSTKMHFQSLTSNLNMMVSERNISFPRGWFSGSMLNFKGVATLTPASCSWWHTLSAIPSTSRRSTSNVWMRRWKWLGGASSGCIYSYIYSICSHKNVWSYLSTAIHMKLQYGINCVRTAFAWMWSSCSCSDFFSDKLTYQNLPRSSNNYRRESVWSCFPVSGVAPLLQRAAGPYLNYWQDQKAVPRPQSSPGPWPTDLEGKMVHTKNTRKL